MTYILLKLTISTRDSKIIKKVVNSPYNQTKYNTSDLFLYMSTRNQWYSDLECLH